MKKTNLAVLAALTLVLLGGLTACDIPDYQLAFEISDTIFSTPGVVRIECDLDNIGWKDLENAQVRVDVVNSIGTHYTGWTNPVDLSVGETATVYADISYSGTYESAQITATGWDTEDDTWKGREVIEF